MEAMRKSAVPLPPFPQAFLPTAVWNICSPRRVAQVIDVTAWFALVVGLVLVGSSFFQLGLFGTYLGDYFGILKPARVTAFPFSHFEHPMYDGSSLLFLAKALFERSTLGLVLAACLFVVYRVAAIWEGSFTDHIYAQRGRRLLQTSARKHAE
jgi:methylene-fatty-acyl-phospholipid synthase